MSGRQRVYRTEAVVLRRMNLGESDRLLTFFSPELGKFRAVAKGVRRPGSRKAGHLEPFTQVRLLLARGRELDVVTQAEAVELFLGLQSDLERLGHAAYMVELLDQFTVEEGGSRPLYELIVAGLHELSKGGTPEAVVRYFELRLLDLIGYRPELFHCLGCGEDIQPQAQFFSASEGGVLCPACGASREDAWPIRLPVLKVLRHYQRSDLPAALAPHVSAGVHGEFEQLMRHYLTHQLERELRSPPFLDQVRSLPQVGAHTDPVA
jgi:DNA repair protein RecO (recombination protein O)